jgi:hypothetical protein
MRGMLTRPQIGTDTQSGREDRQKGEGIERCAFHVVPIHRSLPIHGEYRAKKWAPPTDPWGIARAGKAAFAPFQWLGSGSANRAQPYP